MKALKSIGVWCLFMSIACLIIITIGSAFELPVYIGSTIGFVLGGTASLLAAQVSIMRGWWN
jgi:hypothetical protein